MKIYQIAIMLLLAGMAGGFVAMRAQERMPPAVTWWQATDSLWVYETPGACVYSYTINGYASGASITAIPKTTLPAGKGC